MEVKLTGLRADNPMCFLVSLGVLDLVSRCCDAESRLSWTADNAGPHAVLHSEQLGDIRALADAVCANLKADDVSGLRDLAIDINRLMPETLRQELETAGSAHRHLLSGLVSEYPLRADGQAAMTALCLISFKGTRSLFSALVKAEREITPESMVALLGGPWDYVRGSSALNLDPAARLQDSARMGPNASADGTRGVVGSMPLAVRGMTLVPPLPTRQGRARVASCQAIATKPDSAQRWRSGFTWPIWESPLSRNGVESLIGRNWAARRTDSLAKRGILALFRSEVVPAKDGRRLAYPVRLD